MPRIASKKKDYMVTDFRKWLIGELAVRGYKQKDVAEWFKMSQPAVSVKIRKGEFSLKELIILFEKFDTSEEQIARLLKV